MTFRSLKRLAASDGAGLPQCRLALVADTATAFLATALVGAGRASGLAIALFEAGIDQAEQELLEAGSALYVSAPEVVLIYLASERLLDAFRATPVAEREGFAEAQLARLEALWTAALARARVVVCTCVELDDGVYGQLATQVAASFRYQLARLNLALMDAARQHPGLSLYDLALAQIQLGRATFFDRKLYYAAKLAISLDALPLVATQLVAQLQAARGQVTKCLVLDLDNTLWGGVIAEDGLAGIQLGELGTGRAFTDIQVWARQLRERGVLLAVCSKNDERVAKEPFESHPDMVLKLADIAVFVANWETKVDNLKAIRAALNIGFDAMVFVDDNPFERGMVRELLPEVQVPELPEDPAGFLDALIAANLFEVASVGAADGQRTRQLQDESLRQALAATAPTVEAYLAGLAMVATVLPFDPFSAPRVAQLSQRSNQFNLRTVRYDEQDILRLAASPAHATRTFSLADRFGDHGLVGVLILEVRGSDLFIDTWLMSCRVLKRGLEAFMLAELVAVASTHGCERVVGEYLPTPKNGLVATLLPEFGFTAEAERWVLSVASFVPPRSPIRSHHDL